MKKTLLVHYGPGAYSHTRESVGIIKELLEDKTLIEEVDLLRDVPELFDEQNLNAYVKRNYKGSELTSRESKYMATMDRMTEQLLQVDEVILAYPMYNFHVPASIKAWIDSVVQRGKLFKYGDFGPEGLAKVNSMLTVMSTGGVRIDSSKDFATPYMRFMANYIGIKNFYAAGVTSTNLVLDKELKFIELTNELKDIFEKMY